MEAVFFFGHGVMKGRKGGRTTMISSVESAPPVLPQGSEPDVLLRLIPSGVSAVSAPSLGGSDESPAGRLVQGAGEARGLDEGLDDPEAINATFPETVVQTCIVHLIRHSMNFASWKDRKHVAKALRDVYRAKDADAGLAALDAFEAGPWGEKYPAIAQSWRRNWEHVSPFFVFPEAVRRIVYTTNAIESLNAKIRRAVRTRGHFPSDEAASKLLYLALDHAAEAWKRPPREWFEAKTQFAVIFGERFVNV